MAAAALGGAAGVKAISGDVAGVIKTIISAMDKPIYSNIKTETVTHVAENGDVIVRTRTKGFTIPQGLVWLTVGSVAVWEVGSFIAEGLKKSPLARAVTDIMNPVGWIGYVIAGPLGFVTAEGIQYAAGGVIGQVQGAIQGAASAAASNPYVADVGAVLSPVLANVYKLLGGAPSGGHADVKKPLSGSVTVYIRPPTAMASISNLIQNAVDPVATTAGGLGTKFVSALGLP